MFSHEKRALERVTRRLREHLSDRLAGVYAFGSRVRGDHTEWSDFDVLVVVRHRDPSMESEIMSVFVEQETESGISFNPVIKDSEAFEKEKRHRSPFFQNVTGEGISL